MNLGFRESACLEIRKETTGPCIVGGKIGTEEYGTPYWIEGAILIFKFAMAKETVEETEIAS
jgi:hypothetical protein